MINYPVPFFANTPDDTHCYQAAIKMVIEYFYPDKKYTWETLSKVTAKRKGLWTWPMAGILWLKKKHIDVQIIESFSYNQFVEKKGQYLIEEYGEEVGNAQIKNSNIEQEIVFAKQLLEAVKIEQKIPQISDITRLLSGGYIMVCNINSKSLNALDGYVGHFVVIKGFDDANLYLHDPGLPPLENRKVPFKLFEKAWAYPNEKAKNIMAYKKS